MRPMTVHGKIFEPVSQSQDRSCYLQKRTILPSRPCFLHPAQMPEVAAGLERKQGEEKVDEVFFYFHLNFRLIQTSPGSGKSCFGVRGTVKDHHDDHTDQNSQTKNERGNIFFSIQNKQIHTTPPLLKVRIVSFYALYGGV